MKFFRTICFESSFAKLFFTKPKMSLRLEIKAQCEVKPNVKYYYIYIIFVEISFHITSFTL